LTISKGLPCQHRPTAFEIKLEKLYSDKAESRIFVRTEKDTMKHLSIALLCLAASLTTLAQNTTATNSAQAKDTIGTTVFGLPVHKSYVAPDVVERAKKKYGRALYSIEKSTAENCQESYLIGLIRNGKLTMEWMCDDPKMVFQRRITNNEANKI
jgi:hypothetical protein